MTLDTRVPVGFINESCVPTETSEVNLVCSGSCSAAFRLTTPLAQLRPPPPVAAVPHLQQQRVLADPLDGREKVALQRNVGALLPSKKHAVLRKRRKQRMTTTLRRTGTFSASVKLCLVIRESFKNMMTLSKFSGHWRKSWQTIL